MRVLGKSGKASYVLTDGVQVVLSKCSRRIDQDWSKFIPIDKKLHCPFIGYQTNFGGRTICHKKESRSITSSADRRSVRGCKV